MKHKILVEKEINLRYAKCEIGVSYWEDSEVNGVWDNDDNPTMPCIEEYPSYNNKMEKMWCPIIDLDTGQIINWKQGTTARTNYKSRDENIVKIIDDNDNIVCEYDGYVPRFLAPDNPNWFSGEDYVEMTIDENGFIHNFNNDLKDIFK